MQRIDPDDALQRLLNCIIIAHQEDDCECIDCDECGKEIDHLAELVATGAPTPDVLPAVHMHLCSCGDCREEFDALVAIIRAENTGQVLPDES